jgi:hypothetical protein
MAIDWGVLLNSAGSALTGARRGAREQREYNRNVEVEDAERMFSEWARRRQIENQMAGQQSLNEYRQGQMEAKTRDQEIRDALKRLEEQNKMTRFNNAGGTPVQDAQGNYHILPQNLTGAPTRPTGVTAPLPESKDGYYPPRAGSGGGPGRVTVQQREAMARYELAKPSYDRLKKRYDEGWYPSTTDRLAEGFRGDWRPDWIANIIESDEGQQAYDDLTNLVLATQYTLSGKAVTENEARRLARDLIPQAGDKPDRQEQKKANIDTRLRVIMSAAGETEGITEEPPPRQGVAKRPNPYRQP